MEHPKYLNFLQQIQNSFQLSSSSVDIFQAMKATSYLDKVCEDREEKLI